MSMPLLAQLMALPLCWLLLGACAPPEPADEPGGWAELRVDGAEVRPGDALTLTLVNRSDALLGYNLCAAGLERREGGEWVAHPVPLAEVCTMELRTLSPGGMADFRHTIPARLEPGEYRVRTSLEAPLGEGQATVASGAFTVAA